MSPVTIHGKVMEEGRR